MRILHVVSSIGIGTGVTSFLMNYYRGIDHQLLQFDFLYFNESDSSYQREIESYGGKVYKIKKPGIKRIFHSYREINDFFSKHRNEYKILHLHTLYINWLVNPVARKNGVKKCIAHAHSSNYSDRYMKAIRNCVCCIPLKNNSDYLWSCSEKAAIHYFGKKELSKGNIRIVKNAINYDEFKFSKEMRKIWREKLKIESDYVIGHVGRFVPGKNQIFLVNVLDELTRCGFKAKLVLIGEGPEKKIIEEYVEKIGLNREVLILGQRNNVNELLNIMDLFVLPSVKEGLGIVGIEAQANGLPCYFSTGVPKEVLVSQCNSKFLRLSEGEKKWAKDIMVTGLKRNNSTEGNILLSGYNINVEVKKIEKYYEQIKNEITECL